MKRYFALLMLLSLIFCSCNKDNGSDDIITQNEEISQWLESEMEAHQDYSSAYKDGVIRLTTVKGSGEGLAESDSLTFNYSLSAFSKGSISSTKYFSNMDEDPARIEFGRDKLLKGLEMGLEGVREGECCYIVFSSDFGYGRQRAGTIPANTALAYEIKVVSIKKK